MYRDTHARVVDLLTDAGPSAWHLPVPACPGWSVRDVVAHMAAVAGDWADGTLTGAPTDAETAEHISRFTGHASAEVLEAWADSTARLHALARSDGLEPPLGDIACHEHDIRSAIGKPGARDAPSVAWISDRLLTIMDPPVGLRVLVEDGEYRSGPDDGDEFVLSTTRFESMRWRLGRRSRSQTLAMDWSSNPAPVLEHLFIFGPAAADVIE